MEIEIATKQPKVISKMGKEQVFGLNLNTGTYEQFAEQVMDMAWHKKSAMICVANVHMFVEGSTHDDFHAIINSADMVTPDGLPLCWALQFLKGIRQERVAGMDLLPTLLEKAAERGTSIFFYGATDPMLDKTKEYINEKYPHMNIAGFYSPPFRQLTLEEEEAIIRNINESGASLIFVILGCPKQEKWMFAMRGKIQATMIGIGGALPVLIRIQKRAPLWMQKSGLEWFYRLCQEPRRLFKRYAITNMIFVYLLLKEKMGFKR